MSDQINALELILEKMINWGNIFIANLPNLFVAALIVFVFWIISGFTYKMTRKLINKSHFSQSISHLLSNIAKVAVVLLGFVFALSVLNLDKAVFSLLAGVGVLGLALGFAFRDLAANFISGLYLAISSPFKIGDLIKIDELMGTIHEIRLRDTVIKNFTGQDISVPNKEFMTSKIENYSASGKRRYTIPFGIDYADDLNITKESVESSLNEIPEILKDPPVVVKFEKFSDSAILIAVDYWVKYPGTDTTKIQNQAIANIKKIIDAGKFSMPYPTQTLMLPNSTLAQFKS